MKIGNIDTKEKVFIIAEIGLNHNGSADQCARLIDQAKFAGADAIKLQVSDPNESYAKHTSSYKVFKKNCYYCKKPSDLYLRSANKNNNNNNFNFASSEISIEESELKPNLFFCKNCEIIFSELCDTNFEDNYKDISDPLYIDQIENKKKYFSHLINKISDQIKKNDNVLEIGSYYGAFGSQIKEKVNSYIGIELSSYASKYAKENFNLNIKNQNIYDFFKYSDTKFDVIFMFDVVEHLNDPDLVLKLCAQNLNQNGRLIISTMNMDSLFAKITGKYYQWIIAMHKFYFSDYSMKKFLNKNNLELDKSINDVRIISLEYLFFKLSQKISIFKYLYKFLKNFDSFKNLKIKFSLFQDRDAPGLVINEISRLDNFLVVGIGNIVGWGEGFMRELKEYKDA